MIAVSIGNCEERPKAEWEQKQNTILVPTATQKYRYKDRVIGLFVYIAQKSNEKFGYFAY